MIRDRIEAYTGTFSDTTSLNQWLSNALRLIVSFLSPDKLEAIATPVDLADGTSTSSLLDKVFVRAEGKTGYPAQQGNPRLIKQYSDQNSIHYADDYSPVVLQIQELIKILPNGGTAFLVDTADVNCTDNSFIPGLKEYEYGIILYTVLQAVLSLIRKETDGLAIPSLDSIQIPISPGSFTLTYTDAVLGTYQDITITDPGTAPSYTPPVSEDDFTEVTGLVEATEDTELAQVQLLKVNSQLDKYRSRIQDSMNQFTSQSQNYQAILQKNIEQARLAEQTMIAEADKTTDLNLQNQFKQLEAKTTQYRLQLEGYANDIQLYTAQVTSALQLHQSTVANASTKIQSYTLMYQSMKVQFDEFLMLKFNLPTGQAGVNLKGNQQ